MIRRDDLKTTELLREMQSGDHIPQRVAGPPQTDAERLKEAAEMQEIAADPDHVRTICIGCGADTPLLDSAMCVCGGFVCATCQQLEDEGVCDHLPFHLED